MMSEANGGVNMTILPKLIYSSVISQFLFWEIENITYPKHKIKIRLKRRVHNES